jgi:YidC/Oxa1 family membrane protein insertase
MLLQMVLIWAVFLLVSRYFLPQQAATPAQTGTLLTQAQALEAEGRKTDANVSMADRVKKLEQAVQKYEEFYKSNKRAPEGMQARFQEVNIYDYLANVEGKGTHRYDQAEQLLKDMENSFHGHTGSVKLEEAGQTVPREGDLGKIATDRLNTLRAARDVRNRGKITYQVLDFLVRMTGRRPEFSYFFALMLVVVVLKVVTFPFQKKQYQYQQDMQRIQPLIKETQEKMKGRPPEEINRRIMEVCRENNVNMTAGCLPMLVMMFVLFPVFWMVRDYEYQFINAKFLWIGSAVALKSPWLGDNLAQFDVPLFVIYLFSNVAYSLMQPKPADPQQAQQQKMMMLMTPVIFGVMMFIYKWSSAFMLYWLILNLVSMYQSWILMKQFGLSGATGGSGGGGGPSGNGGLPGLAPSAPLGTMKGIQAKSGDGNGRNGSARPGAAPERIRPRRSDRRASRKGRGDAGNGGELNEPGKG